MALYALVGPGNVIKYVQDQPTPNIQTKPGWRWLIIVGTLDQPAYDPATQNISGPTYVVNANDVTQSWSITAKTAQELDDYKQTQVDGLNLVIFKILFNHENRIRTLEGNPQVTANQFKTGIKAIL